MKGYIDIVQAAEVLGFSTSHVRYLIYQGDIKAEKIGRNYFFKPADLKKVKRLRSPRGFRNITQKTAIETKEFVAKKRKVKK